MTDDTRTVTRAEAPLEPLDIEMYPVGSRVDTADWTPIERAWAEAEHEGCETEPKGHPIDDHAPWSGGDLDGVEPWPSFIARLRRHGLTLTLATPEEPRGEPDPLRAAAQRAVAIWFEHGDLMVGFADALMDLRAALDHSKDEEER